MFHRYRRCHCQNNYNPEVIETLCQNVGVSAEYAQVNTSGFNCGCNCKCNCGCGCSDNDTMDCGCGFDEESSVFPLNPMLAQSYVPIQEMDKTFTPCCGLKMGTIFPELVSPYMPGQSMAEIEYLKNTNEIGEGCNQC